MAIMAEKVSWGQHTFPVKDLCAGHDTQRSQRGLADGTNLASAAYSPNGQVGSINARATWLAYIFRESG